jgi:GntR family transcriptional regulator
LVERFKVSRTTVRKAIQNLVERGLVEVRRGKGTFVTQPRITQDVGPVNLTRAESATENLGRLAMLNALSTALFAVAFRLAREVTESPDGLLALAANPHLVPAALRPL